jgi:hypothetical protein
MSRLPIPGEDDGTWGYILNGFLEVAHNEDGSLKFDGTSSDIQPLGAQAAGNTGKVADAGHVHPMPTAGQVGALQSTDDLSAISAANATANDVSLNAHKITNLASGTAATDAATVGQIPASLPPGGTASGDLSGTYPDPTVSKLNGVSLSGTPSTGQLLMATSGSTATWKAGGLSDWLNAVNVYGADPTGATDSSTAINNALAAATEGQTVYLPTGTYLVNGSTALAMTVPGLRIKGDGPSSTVIQIGASFSASAVINVTAGYCWISELSIVGANSSVLGQATAFNGIQLQGGRNCRVVDVFFQYINGWCVESEPNGGNVGYATMLRGVSALNCAGGVHIKSNNSPGVNYGAQHFLTDMNLQQIGVGTGGSPNLDAFLFEDAEDILGENFNVGVSDQSTGSALHIKGHCATVSLTNMDLGSFPNAAGESNSIILIEDSGGNSPSDIKLVNGVCQQGSIGLTISGGANQIKFTNWRFFNNYNHGTIISGTGSTIDFAQCSWVLNGRQTGLSSSQYDLNWSGSATGTVTNSKFQTALVAQGSAGVQYSVNVASGQHVEFLFDQFLGTGAGLANYFTNQPSAAIDSSAGVISFLTGSHIASLQPSGDSTGATDLSNMNTILSALPTGGVLVLAPGTYWINGPLVLPNKSVELAGSLGATQGGGGSPGVGTTIKATSTFAQGSAPSLAMICMGQAARQGLRDLWLYGGSASAVAGLEGIDSSAFTGTAGTIYRVGINNMPGWGAYLGAGAGWMTDTMIIQNCGSNPGTNNLDNGFAGGYYSNQVDMMHTGIHTQTSTGYGIDIHNSDQYLLLCRADISTQQGFHMFCFNGSSMLGIGARMIGCATESNQQEGCYLGGGGASTYGPYQLVGCSFTGDGQGGTYAAVRADGRVVASLTDVNVSGNGTFPAYGVATSQNSGTHAVPDLVEITGGSWQVGSAYVNDAGPATKLVGSLTTMGVVGAISGLSGTTSFGQVFPTGASQNYAGLFGDGTDGAVTLDGTTTVSWATLSGGNYTMTRNPMLTRLTINSGVTLNTAGWLIFCRGTVTNNGTISAVGGNASGSTAGTGPWTTNAPLIGNAGASGSTGAGTAGSSSGARIGVGTSGGGGAGVSAGGASGAARGSTSMSQYRPPFSALSVLSWSNGGPLQPSGACGAGAGGGDGTNAGGGGGGGGGIIVIYAWVLTNNGTMTVAGGNGGTPAAGNAGGGGGGGGGVILAYTLSAWTAGTLTLSGGSAGTGIGTGVSGTAGTSGTSLNVIVQ